VTRTKCPITMYKVSNSEISRKYYALTMYKVSNSEISRKYYGPLIEHAPHWINFTIIAFIREKTRYFRCPYQIWSKFISYDTRKKWEI
jgi:hypothetical protein